jgi:hypothetical protein
MASKVGAMLELVQAHAGLAVRVFSGMEAGRLRQALLDPAGAGGTVIGRP